MRRRHLPLLLLLAAPLASAKDPAGSANAPASANDFPTRARVEFVLACMQESKAPPTESMYKCSCAIDAIAEKVHYSEWVDLATVANGITIAGERGGVMRDIKDGRKLIDTYRKLQEGAKKQCFLQSD